VAALLADPRVEVETVTAGPRWPDVTRSSGWVGIGFPRGPGEGGVDWSAEWCAASRRVGAAIDEVLDASPGLTGARLARDTVAALPSGALLVLGSSTPVRDVDRLAVPRADISVMANRGVAGIDGTISTAVGAALVHGGPAFALMGDLTFLHDLTGLLVGEGERVPDLTVVVPDNDGGGIFAQLEPGEDRHTRDYRRVFGTPHGRDLVAVAEALGWDATRVATAGELAAALALGGPRLVVVGTDQRAEAALAAHLRQAAAAALA
jgi:2-succinyl-5-enolpyruvyl-6-hydroxy-3-cyclohexene-1-carboxylate synthase